MSVEQLVRAYLRYEMLPDSPLVPFARTCETCGGTRSVKAPPEHYTERLPCTNPDCIDGKEYITAARAYDSLMEMAEQHHESTKSYEAWLRIGPKLLEAGKLVSYMHGGGSNCNGLHIGHAFCGLLAETKEAGLV